MSYNKDYVPEVIRDSAILTTSEVAGKILDATERYNQLNLYIDFTKGSLTSAEVRVYFTDELRYTLAYDGQTSNFDTDIIVRGRNSRAKAKIVTDTDGGATGTLVLKNVEGTFLDNEPLEQVAGVTIALVNGTLTEASVWRQETVSAITGGSSALTALEHTMAASGNYRHLISIKDRYIKVTADGTGTVTSSLMGITAILGNV